MGTGARRDSPASPRFGHHTPGLPALLAVAGAALWLMRRRPAWVAGWVVVVLLGLFAAASTNRLADGLTFPWYHLENRIVPNVAFFVPFFAAVTLAFGVGVATRAVRRSWASVPATAAMVALLSLFAGIRGFRADSAYVRTSFNSDSRSIFNQAFVGHTSLAAFRWLHDHAARGDTVANEPFSDAKLMDEPALPRSTPHPGAYDPGVTAPTGSPDVFTYLVGICDRSYGRQMADGPPRHYGRVGYASIPRYFVKPDMNRDALLRNPQSNSAPWCSGSTSPERETRLRLSTPECSSGGIRSSR